MSFVGDSYDAALMCTCQAQTTLATLVLHTEAAPLSLVSLGGFGSFLMCSEDKRVSVLGQSRKGQPLLLYIRPKAAFLHCGAWGAWLKSLPMQPEIQRQRYMCPPGYFLVETQKM